LKRLKIILRCSLLIGSIYILYTFINCKYTSRYNLDITYIRGKVLSYEIDGDLLQLEIKGKEKIKCFYKLSSEKEKNLYESSLQLGDMYDFYGILEEPSTNTNFHLFSYKNYLLSEKIYYVMQVENMELYKKNDSLFYSLNNFIYKSIQKRSTFEYLVLLIFGYDDQLDSNMLEMYRDLGISHLIAISGMHISLFSLLLLKLLKWIKNKWVQYCIVIVILWIYAFLVGFTASVLRAVISFTCISVFNLINKKVNSIWILLCTAFLFLLYNPFYLYSVGFLFSFVVTFFLLISNKMLGKYKSYIIKILIISLIAFFAGIPIVSRTFYETNLLGPIINIPFVPFISFVVFPLALITYFIPVMEPLFQVVIAFLELLVQISNDYLVISFIVPYMEIYMIIIYYIILFLILYYRKFKWIVVIVICLILHSYQKLFQRYPVITMIDVGQGDSILIELPYSKGDILIDTGGSISYEKENWQVRETKGIAETTIVPYLKSVGIHNLDYLILSHGDYDHIGEAINLVNNFKVEKVIFNCGPFNDLESELIKVLDKKKIPYYSCIKELNIDNNKLYFLQTKEYDNENDNSNVIYTELNGYKFMFMGDASSTTEKEILNKYNLPNIDVLKVGHHGSKTSSSEEFIDEINPKYSIISVGKNNKYGHPNKEALDNLKDSKIYRTDQNGSIKFKIKNDNLKVETCTSYEGGI